MSITDENKSSAALLAPDTILQSRYRVVRQLGRGGMGAVYEAIDLRLGHTVALKQTLTNDEEQWKQFEHEARLMAWLNHPVLPRVSDYFTEGHRAFFVMQFVEGSDLAEILAQQPGPLPRNAVVAWADQLLDALIYLHTHERQIVHRDIKPHNLKITPTGQIVLLDFGLAKTQAADSSGSISCTSVFGYTPRYAPLEQIQDLGTSPQSDIYALGATLYHLLTGVKPPDALARATALVSARPNPLKPANEINPAVGLELAEILTRAMAQNPDERYGSATEFREALRRIGRVSASEVEYVAHHTEIDSTVVETGETTIVRSIRLAPTGRLGSHAIAAMFVILLTAFGVFCSYYPWKIPPVQQSTYANAESVLPTNSAGELKRHDNRHSNRARNQKKP
jgi:serine/threonine protein kinase